MRPLVVSVSHGALARPCARERRNAAPRGVVRRTGVALAVLILTLGAALPAQTIPAGSAAAEPGGVAAPPLQGARVNAPLARIVSLDLRHVPLREALDAIDQQAHLGLAYSTRLVPLRKRVTITRRRVTAGEALSIVLAGTGVSAVTTSAGTVLLVASDAAPPDTTAGGAVWGQVTDSTSGQPLAGAVIELEGTSLTTQTNERGVFLLREVPAGAHVITVRQLGYVPVERDVAVVDGKVARVAIHLQMASTRLQEVVTTATGNRRLVELGNDVTVINADSIVATQPVASVTDLLENRVPGLVVQRTSGAPGDPARLRLRGVGSISLPSDPIVIVDGARVYSTVSSDRSRNLAALDNYLTPSPLETIDVNSIATVEVFKGPSATSAYGPDAAGGVIVITTKRGQAGPPRWTASLSRGLTYIPGKYAPGYLRLGHTPLNDTPVPCPLGNATCIPDSLVTFQALNDPSTSPLTQGNDTRATLGVSGGIGGLSYSLDGHFRRATGTTRLPDFERARYVTAQGAPPPSWMRHPDELTEWGQTARLSSQIGSRATVSLTSMLSRSSQQRSNLDGQLSSLMRTYLDRGTGTYYVASLNSLQDNQEIYTAYATQVRDVQTNFTTSLGVSWTPAPWLTANANAGINLISRKDDAFEPPGIVPGDDSIGSIGTGSGASLVKTASVQGTATSGRLLLGLHGGLTLGADYTSTSTADNAIYGTGLPQGATSVAQAATIQGTQASSDLGSFGMYASPTLHGYGFWLETGVRLDGGTSYGSAVHLVAFPKVSLSYMASEQTWFPQALRSVFDNLRLRFAYGQAGRVPTPTERLRLYQLSSTTLDGSVTNIATLSTLGNDQLEPERTGEIEGGFDADLLRGRVSVELTGYRKLTRNAILGVRVAPSVYGLSSYETNVGTIRNEGLEASLHVDLLRTQAIRWSEEVHVSHNRNVLVSLNEGSADQAFTGLRLREGYPVDAVWAYPLLGYADRNQDGVIGADELLFGDTLAYMGSASPAYQVGVTTTIALWRNTLSLDASLGYRSGFTQTMNADRSYGISRGYNDPTAPLAAQAFAASFQVPLGSLPSGSGPYGNYQQVSEWRLTSLALRWRVPERAGRWLGTDALSVSLQGTNLWLHTNYRGKDPNVNDAFGLTKGFTLADSGVLPQPRTWLLQLSAAY